jgi:hypothetical protein
LLPFKIGSLNEQKARESRLWLKESDGQERRFRKQNSEHASSDDPGTPEQWKEVSLTCSSPRSAAASSAM